MPSNSTPMVFFCDNLLLDKKMKVALSVMSKEPIKVNKRIQRDKNH